MSKNGLVGQTCQSRGARLGPSGTGSRGVGRPGRATTVARPHNCPWSAATGPPTPGRRPAGCRASQAGSLPRAHARRPANTPGAGVRDRRSLEHRGSALRPRPGPLAGPMRASRRQGRRSVRMGATMVERLVGGGAARGGKHCPRPPLARGSTAVLRWGPDSGPRPGPWCGRRAQPIAPAALEQDRA